MEVTFLKVIEITRLVTCLKVLKFNTFQLALWEKRGEYVVSHQVVSRAESAFVLECEVWILG